MRSILIRTRNAFVPLIISAACGGRTTSLAWCFARPGGSEDDFESELDVARITAVHSLGIVENRAARGQVVDDISARIRSARVVDAVCEAGHELSVVQQIEKLGGELNFRSFAHREILEQV